MAYNVEKIYSEKFVSLIQSKVDEKTGLNWLNPVYFTGGDISFKTKKEYKGVNNFVLPLMRAVFGFKSKVWLTQTNIEELHKKDNNVKLKKGSKSVPVVFWNVDTETDKEGNPVLDEDGNEIVKFTLRYYNVFNSDCVTGYDFSKHEPVVEKASDEEVHTMQEWESLLLEKYKGEKPIIYHDTEGRNFYRPSDDEVHLAPFETFRGSNQFLDTYAHELVHSTGHKSRLDRLNKMASFGSENYGKEELVAEMGSSMICARYGILEKTIDNQAEYLKNWLKAIKSEPSMLINAFSKAEKAVKWIFNELDE